MQLLGEVKGLVSTMTDRALSSSPLEGATALQLNENVAQKTNAIRDLTSEITSMNKRQVPAQAPVPTMAEPRRMSAPGKENSVGVRRLFRQQDRNQVCHRFEQRWGCPVSPSCGDPQ